MVEDRKTHKIEEIGIPYFSISVAWSQLIQWHCDHFTIVAFDVKKIFAKNIDQKYLQKQSQKLLVKIFCLKP